MNEPARTYHHGDLRNALIVAAAELIEEGGSLEFSITDAAKRAGVSSAAPYRHFKDKEDLLRAVRELAFIGLSDRVAAASDATAPGSVDRIIAIGRAYIDYACAKKPFFALMWEDRGDMAVRKAEVSMKRTGFDVLTEAVADLCAAHDVDCQLTPVRLATQLWAFAHGIATLEVNNMLNVIDAGATADDILDRSTRALLVGLHKSR